MSNEMLAGTRTPRPPEKLKGRVLRAARAAAAGAPRPARAPWGFTRLDLAWVVALLVLVAGNAWLTVAGRRAWALVARQTVSPQPAVGPDGERDLLAFGIRLHADAASPEPSITLGEVLRDGS
jgi:hypothetical protein